ncbi:MAG: hypothetical protein EVA37_04920 [Flavobacteriales bacterium]|nr:MAG: hypothetical protein EVA37_04920 [Flavobacteriales bacterium]
MKKLILLLLFISLVSCDYSASRIEENSTVSGEKSSTKSVYQLDWLTGQREGSHDGGILEQTWLPPRSGTITALVRSTKESDTRFVEIIHIREINGSLELNLQIFNNSLEPENISATYSRIHKFELYEIGDRYLAFKGVSDGAHRSLSYQRSEGDIFSINIETNVGDRFEIKLKPII